MNVESLAEQIHLWYLEATEPKAKGAYNEKAQVSYEDLSDDQKDIDRYIAKKILETFTSEETTRSAADN